MCLPKANLNFLKANRILSSIQIFAHKSGLSTWQTKETNLPHHWLAYLILTGLPSWLLILVCHSFTLFSLLLKDMDFPFRLLIPASSFPWVDCLFGHGYLKHETLFSLWSEAAKLYLRGVLTTCLAQRTHVHWAGLSQHPHRAVTGSSVYFPVHPGLLNFVLLPHINLANLLGLFSLYN